MGLRPQIVVLMLAICLGAGTFILFFKPGARTAYEEPFSTQGGTITNATADKVPSARVVAPSPGNTLAESGKVAGLAADPGLPDQGAQSVQTRVNELQNAAMSNDPNALVFIVPDLTSRDPRIRQAALEAAVQFGSTNAIPALKEAYGQSESPEEQVRIQKAIDFLALLK